MNDQALSAGAEQAVNTIAIRDAERVTEGPVYRGPDRRAFTWRTIFHAIRKPRRKMVNRFADRNNHYVDFHPSSTLWLCVGIVFLAAVDAALTLHFQNLGIRQLNGVVASLVAAGDGVFAAVKIFGTAACMMLLAAVSSLKTFRVLPARYLFHIIFFAYLLYVLNLLKLL